MAAEAGPLKADMILSADGLQRAPGQPQIVDARKGMVSLEIVVTGPRLNRHSGMRGGGIANPAMAPAQILCLCETGRRSGYGRRLLR